MSAVSNIGNVIKIVIKAEVKKRVFLWVIPKLLKMLVNEIVINMKTGIRK